MVIFLLLIFLAAAPAGAAEVQATATVDATKILIGDQVRLKIDVTHPDGFSVSVPSNLSELLKPFEIVSQSAFETKRTEAGPVSSMTLVLTSFEAGKHAIPALPFGDAGTAPLIIEVESIEVNTEEDIRDVKPPLDVPLSWREVLPYALGAAAAALLLWLAFYIWKKRRKGEKILPAPPPRPAHELALEALRALEAKRLWQSGRVKEYHSELTDILRTYIERKYGVPAMEMTTEDILTPDILQRWEAKLQKDLSEVLTLADFVKFAKMQPAPEENERGLRMAYSFVETTQELPAANDGRMQS